MLITRMGSCSLHSRMSLDDGMLLWSADTSSMSTSRAMRLAVSRARMATR